MTTKNIFIVAGITIAAAGFVIKDEIERLRSLFAQFKIAPIAIRNFSAKLNGFEPTMSFNMDLHFFNPTYQNFVANGTLMIIKKLLFYDQSGNFIGVSDANIRSLKVDANTGTTVKNVPITLDAKMLIGAVAAMISNGLKPENIKVEMIVSVLGLEYVIK